MYRQTMATAKYDNVTKTFNAEGGSVVAVDDLSIEIRESEFLVLVGPSGCGKSTTLRLLAGLETITDGEVRIEDRVVNDDKPKDRDIAMVFQNYALYPHKTVRENMAFGLEMTTDLSDSEIEERVVETAEMLDIADLLDRKPKALSGGQKQRVALGRAIVREPTVFLMDEPLSNLDAKLRTGMRTELQELHDRLGVATVYVTHDQTEAMTMGDRIVILDDGELQQVGTPLECYHEPANLFVAGFIGSPSMNFVNLNSADSSEQGIGDDLTYQFTENQAEAIRENASTSTMTLGIRPEDVEVAESNGPRTVTAEVRVVETMGKENFLYLEIEGEEFTASIPGDYLIEAGETIRLRFPAEKIHCFDTQTGEALFHRTQSTEKLPDAARV
jgi:multiple sugar transport system ATP-binding protein